MSVLYFVLDPLPVSFGLLIMEIVNSLRQNLQRSKESQTQRQDREYAASWPHL